MWYNNLVNCSSSPHSSSCTWMNKSELKTYSKNPIKCAIDTCVSTFCLHCCYRMLSMYIYCIYWFLCAFSWIYYCCMFPHRLYCQFPRLPQLFAARIKPKSAATISLEQFFACPPVRVHTSSSKSSPALALNFALQKSLWWHVCHSVLPYKSHSDGMFGPFILTRHYYIPHWRWRPRRIFPKKSLWNSLKTTVSQTYKSCSTGPKRTVRGADC